MPKITIEIPDDMMAELEEAFAASNPLWLRMGQPIDKADWLRQSILRYIRSVLIGHRERGLAAIKKEITDKAKTDADKIKLETEAAPKEGKE